MTLTTPSVDTDVDTILQEAAEMPACAFDEREAAEGLAVITAVRWVAL